MKKICPMVMVICLMSDCIAEKKQTLILRQKDKHNVLLT